MAETDSGRKKARRRTVLMGKVFDDGDRFCECTILDLSRSGARVRLREDFGDAGHVHLKLDRFNEMLRAKVMWQRDDLLGLRFVAELTELPPSMEKIFELLEG